MKKAAKKTSVHVLTTVALLTLTNGCALIMKVPHPKSLLHIQTHRTKQILFIVAPPCLYLHAKPSSRKLQTCITSSWTPTLD